MPTVKEVHVNGVRREIDADAERSLLSVLRDDLDLTGTKYGCGEGLCGACTVWLNDEPVRSCRTLVGEVGDRKIRTIEGLASGETLHPLQQAFLDAGAMQCGYCTAGMIMAGAALLAKSPHPGRDDIVRGMAGNVCRCGTYDRIIKAIEAAGRQTRGAGR